MVEPRAPESIADHQRLLWIAAALLYGVGDAVTTLWGLSTGGVTEAGPLAAPVMELYGRAALIGIKIVVFSMFYLLWRVLRSPGRVAVPLALAVVGGVVFGWNLAVILGVL